MKIVMRDGRVFQGTPLQIVQAMRAIAFTVPDYTIQQYVEWIVENAQRHEDVALHAVGDTDEALATSLIQEMLRTGLTQRG